MLVNSLLATVERYPDKIAVKDPTRELTFSQLLTFAQTIERTVAKETTCPRVGLMLPTTAAGLGTIAGILWAGRTFVPLNFLLQPVELERIVADAQIDLVISTIHFQEILSQVPVRTLYLEKLGLKRRYLWSKLCSPPPPPVVGPDDLAAIVYTSGTSGEPKGVCLTHANFLSNAKAIVEHIRITADDHFVAVLPNFHVFGLTVLNFVPMILGTSLTCIPRFSPQDMHRAIVEDRTNLVIAIPSMFSALSRLKTLDRAEFSHVKVAASGGEPLPSRVYEEVYARTGMRIIEGYGMTETSPIISADLPWAHKPGTVGPPLAGVEVQLRDAQGNVIPLPTSRGLSSAPTDQPAVAPEGELYVRGPLVMKGYYHKPAETAAAIDAQGWLRTGDIVRIDADGYIKITGRAKDLIIVGGENVYPREIEEVLDRHPAVEESAIIGRKDGLRGEAIVGFVKLREGCSVSSTDLRAFCRESLAGFKVPREIHIRSDLPRGPTGKILKRELPSLLQQ
ncbi:MAG TPA: AMP-binding protein [Phycisphaerae bacterium]|nr:AMP-binding protein [Phycisphaerae bacterium]HOJ75853.1 AMP-binding protein [Phycisphaerae bacterium]HOM53300.1 AMP-binding protein [Phycisphaerae bacterium]HON65919.1 AMP-binding protein [Phycisphaerae bacterium]HOQ85567.1 AMP-binding protein [Phycisphaerae bacterium]